MHKDEEENFYKCTKLPNYYVCNRCVLDHKHPFELKKTTMLIEKSIGNDLTKAGWLCEGKRCKINRVLHA